MADVEVHVEKCPQCAKEFRALTKSGARGALQLHLRRVHGDGRAPRAPAPPPGAPPAPAPPSAPAPRRRDPEPGPSGEDRHCPPHRWRLLRPDDPRERAAILHGYNKICQNCREVER